MLLSHEIEVRVRYHETDAQGHVHHATYINYFELARTEMLRSAGRPYDELEQAGVHLVVAEISCRYFAPSGFGDVIRVQVTTEKARGARIWHSYRVLRGEQRRAEGSSIIACVDSQGKVRRLPDWLSGHRGAS